MKKPMKKREVKVIEYDGTATIFDAEKITEVKALENAFKVNQKVFGYDTKYCNMNSNVSDIVSEINEFVKSDKGSMLIVDKTTDNCWVTYEKGEGSFLYLSEKSVSEEADEGGLVTYDEDTISVYIPVAFETDKENIAFANETIRTAKYLPGKVCKVGRVINVEYDENLEYVTRIEE